MPPLWRVWMRGLALQKRLGHASQEPIRLYTRVTASRCLPSTPRRCGTGDDRTRLADDNRRPRRRRVVASMPSARFTSAGSSGTASATRCAGSGWRPRPVRRAVAGVGRVASAGSFPRHGRASRTHPHGDPASGSSTPTPAGWPTRRTIPTIVSEQPPPGKSGSRSTSVSTRSGHRMLGMTTQSCDGCSPHWSRTTGPTAPSLSALTQSPTESSASRLSPARSSTAATM